MRFLKRCLPAFCVLLMWCSCISGTKEGKDSTKAETKYIDTVQVSEAVLPAPQPEKSPMARYMDSLGLIDVTELDSSLVVKLMYTQADNFTGEVLYDDLSEAYLHPVKTTKVKLLYSK